MIETNIQVKLDHFDGPLGLLLHLIQREELNIRELEINQITHQYLDYLKKLQDVNFDVAGEYLYLAASLLYIKSKSVTEDEEEKIRIANPDDLEITTKTQLILKLEELARFQKMGEKLMSLPRRDEDIFVKPRVDRKALQNSILLPMDLEALTGVMVDLLRREQRKYTVVKRDRLSIKEKLIQLKTNLQIGSKTTLDKLIDWEKGTEEIVITFISLLELARLKKLEIYQNEQNSEVYIDVIDNLDSFDVETADGFEPEDEGEKVDVAQLANEQMQKPESALIH
ncbi:MAG: segregation/condensation protein A [Halobacteriovoraceae bacterium]|jgi:segregation and condensation protein A|nr:segregation/condensation protein A [Halobacteriovoraceae bacterium]